MSQQQLEKILQKEYDLQRQLRTVDLNVEYLQEDLNNLMKRQETMAEDRLKEHQSRMKEIKTEERKIEEENADLSSELEKSLDKISSLKRSIMELKTAATRKETPQKLDHPSRSNFESNENQKALLQKEIENIEIHLREAVDEKKRLQNQIVEAEEFAQEKTLELNEEKNTLQEKFLETCNIKNFKEEEKLKEVNVTKKGNSMFAEFHDYTEAANKKIEKIEEMLKVEEADLSRFKVKMRKIEEETYRTFCQQQQQLPSVILDLEVSVTKLSAEKKKSLEKRIELEKMKEANVLAVIHPKSIVDSEAVYQYFSSFLSNLRKEIQKTSTSLKLERFLTVVVQNQLTEVTQTLNRSKSVLQDEEMTFVRLQDLISSKPRENISVAEKTSENSVGGSDETELESNGRRSPEDHRKSVCQTKGNNNVEIIKFLRINELKAF